MLTGNAFRTVSLVLVLSTTACGNASDTAVTATAEPSATQAYAASSATPAGSASSSAPSPTTSSPMASATASATATSREERCLAAARACIDPLIKTMDDKLIDCMPDDLVAAVGGREKLSKALVQAKEMLHKSGVSFESAEVELPTSMTTNEGRTFAVLPSHVIMQTPTGRLGQAGFLVGVSDDDGQTWRFVDGGNPANVKKLAKVPASLTLPERQKPEPLP